jgi:hypothetical protein
MLNRCPGFDSRVYAVTQKDKRIGGVLLGISVAQYAAGIAMVVRAALSTTCEFLSSFPSVPRLRFTIR